MNYLAIDTSGKHLTVVLKLGGKFYIRYDGECGVKHSAALMPAVEGVLDEASARLDDLDFIAAVVGAGSFTGIRIGVSTVKALCFAADKPCLKVTSFEVLAYDTGEGNAVAAIDANHGCYYAQRFAGFKPVTEAAFIDGSGVGLNALLTGGEEIAADFGENRRDFVRGLINAVEAKTAEVTRDINSLTPLYVRKSQAEENR